MTRRALPFTFALLACGPNAGPGPLAAIAGRWEADAVDPGVTDVLEIDDDGDGTAELYRRLGTSLARVEGRAVVVTTDDEDTFELSLRCEGRSFDCERYDFDATCILDGTDELRCDAPEWYYDENGIDFRAAD